MVVVEVRSVMCPSPAQLHEQLRSCVHIPRPAGLAPAHNRAEADQSCVCLLAYRNVLGSEELGIKVSEPGKQYKEKPSSKNMFYTNTSHSWLVAAKESHTPHP